MCMSILYIYAESVQCLSKPKEDLKLQDCEWPDLGVGSCPQRSKEGIGPAGIGISDVCHYSQLFFSYCMCVNGFFVCLLLFLSDGLRSKK